MTQPIVVGICGSLSRASFNRAALRAFHERLPQGMGSRLLDLHDIPLYNADLEEPASVVALKNAIEQASAVVIAAPEYNYGISGVLKNALDWVSRPAYKSAFSNKPVTLLGASIGPIGTARAQGQLKQILLALLADVYPAPELCIGLAKTKFDEKGAVVDPALDAALSRHASGFADWFITRSSR